MNRIILIAILVCFVQIAFSQNVTFNGYVKDSETGESLIGATLFETKIKKGNLLIF